MSSSSWLDWSFADLHSSDSTRTLPTARMRSTVLSGRRKSVPLSAEARRARVLQLGKIQNNQARILGDGAAEPRSAGPE